MTYIPLPEIAAKIAEWYPWLHGRSLAVSDDDISANNMPTLPIAMVASNEVGVLDGHINNNKAPFLYDDFVVEFWLAVERHKKDKSETPFFAFYDYYKTLQSLFYHLGRLAEERKSKFEFVSYTPSTTEKVVILTYRFRQRFCLEEPEDMQEEPEDIIIRTNLNNSIKFSQPISEDLTDAGENKNHGR